MNAHSTYPKVHRSWENEKPTLKRAARYLCPQGCGVLGGEGGFH